jgi:NADPH2:quinone reductase
MDIMVRMNGAGGPDRLEIAANPSEEPGAGEIRLRHEAIGVNFIDIYHRTGLYPLPTMPAVLGVEGAGVVEAVGSGVTRWAVGDRVAYAGAPVGAYAATRLLPETRAVPLPADIPARLAAASMLKGLTAHMLMTRIYPVGPQSTLLVHAAAGGLGALLTRWAKHLGAMVIGAVGSVEKADLARAAGADHVIVGRNVDLVAAVGTITAGRGVDYAIDGIGGTMLAKTLACVRKFGTVASIGQAAGPIPPLPVEALGPVRSLSLARPSVMAYAAETGTYQRAAVELFALLGAGIAPAIGGEYALSDAAQAHADLEAGRSTGSLLLLA